MQNYSLFNIKIHFISQSEIENIIEKKIKEPALITTFNIDFLKISTTDEEFKKICNHSLLNLPDGYGIVKLIKKKYNVKIPRFTGNDIFKILIEFSQRKNFKIAIVGGSTKVSLKTQSLLITKFNFKRENILCLSPPYLFEKDVDENERVVEKIKEFRPDFVFAALGCPRQEKWLYNNMCSFGSKVNIGIGGTLDFFTNTKKRSPLFLQNLGFEWLWRLVNEPKRLFKRYILSDLPFFLKTYFFKKF